MTTDVGTTDVGTTDVRTADVLIVGGGSTGVVLAARLSEHSDVQVTLVEAGPVDVPPEKDVMEGLAFAHKQDDWGLHATLTGNRVAEYPQGKIIGGGSAVNQAVFLRGLPADYDGWGVEGWRWADLQPCFDRVSATLPLRRFGLDDLTPVQRAFVDAAGADGHAWVDDPNESGEMGIGPLPRNMDGPIRVSAEMAYLRPVRAERPNLVVRGGSTVRRLQVESGRVVGVELDGGEQLRAGETIVCAGAINTPALLLRSGLDRPGLGENLQEHLGMFVFASPRPGAIEPAPVNNNLALRCGIQVDGDVQLVIGDYAGPDGGVMLAATAGIQLPDSRGTVTIDGDGAPVVDLRGFSDGGDLDVLRAGLRLGLDYLASEPFAPYADAVPGVPTDDEIRAGCLPWYHPSGTCALGTVVDPAGRLDGVAGLRVFDASIIPRIPRANTNATCLAIGERAAEVVAAG